MITAFQDHPAIKLRVDMIRHDRYFSRFKIVQDFLSKLA